MLTAADTAFAIAAIRADERELFSDPYAARFHAAGAHAEEGTQRFLGLPFFRDGIRLRTRFIDDTVRAALDDGVRQIVILGAGFDARGLRMPEIAACGARVWELDLAEQLERKRAILAGGGVTRPAWITHVACDLAVESPVPVLATAGHDARRATLFVWEGVIAYLRSDAIDRTLQLLAAFGAPGSRLVFDVGARAFHPETVAEHTVGAGWASCDAHGGDELWRRYLPGEPHPSSPAVQLAVARV